MTGRPKFDRTELDRVFLEILNERYPGYSWRLVDDDEGATLGHPTPIEKQLTDEDLAVMEMDDDDFETEVREWDATLADGLDEED